MKIALISPAGAMHRYDGMFSKNLHYAPMTLTLLAALVPEELNAQIHIYDETAGPIPLDLDADIVGITCITGTSERAYRFADYYRSHGMTVVLGGPHPSLEPEEAGKHAHSVVIGVADETWPQLLRDFAEDSTSIRSFYLPPDKPCIEQRPSLRRDLLDRSRYITLNTVEATRGCHLNCSFCAYPRAFGPGQLKRPVREVIEDIKGLPKTGIDRKMVVFPDVNLLSDLDYARELFTAMIPLKRWWFGLATSDVVMDEELLVLLRKSGCKGLLIGFESVNQAAQYEMRKGINHVDEYRSLMEGLHRQGIMVMGCFAFGSDEEDAGIFERTAKFARQIKLDLPRYAIITPFPQTEFYLRLKEEGRIISEDRSLYDVEHCVFKPAQMSANELEEGNARAWAQSYTWKDILSRFEWQSPRILRFFFIYLLANIGYRKYAREFEAYGPEVMSDHSDIPPAEGIKVS